MEGYCPLASGSKGNCVYLGVKNTKVLIDCGISGKAAEAKLREINVELSDIDAILVTHEHIDHIAGLRVLAYKLGIPVLANTETAKGIVNFYHGDCPKFKIFSTGETFHFKDLEIHPFSIQHDTLDPVAFTIKVDGLKMGFCTDLGHVTSLVRNHLQECDYLYLESNHEPNMVHSSTRPHSLKLRILGKSGHLSNESCGELLTHIAHDGLKFVHLAHLSQECNTPEVAISVVKNILEKNGISLDMCIAPQDMISKPIFF